MSAENLSVQTPITKKEKARLDIICERESISASDFLHDALCEKIQHYRDEHKRELFSECMSQIVAHSDREDQIEILEKYSVMINDDPVSAD